VLIVELPTVVGYVYIIRSEKNKSFYVGKNKYTKKFLPWDLVFSQKFNSLPVARKAEYWIKKQKDTRLIQKIILDGKLMKLFG
jgi:predicted GIY-YIG superfamily endonuclease